MIIEVRDDDSTSAITFAPMVIAASSLPDTSAASVVHVGTSFTAAKFVVITAESVPPTASCTV